MCGQGENGGHTPLAVENSCDTSSKPPVLSDRRRVSRRVRPSGGGGEPNGIDELDMLDVRERSSGDGELKNSIISAPRAGGGIRIESKSLVVATTGLSGLLPNGLSVDVVLSLSDDASTVAVVAAET